MQKSKKLFRKSINIHKTAKKTQAWFMLDSYAIIKNICSFRESSFNMTRGDEDIEGGLRKFLDTRKGASENIRGGGTPKICILQNQQERGILENWTASEGGC